MPFDAVARQLNSGRLACDLEIGGLTYEKDKPVAFHLAYLLFVWV